MVDDVRAVALHESKNMPLPCCHTRCSITGYDSFMSNIPGGIIIREQHVDFTDTLQQMRDIRVLHKTVLCHAVPVTWRALLYPDPLFFPHIGHIQDVNGQR